MIAITMTPCFAPRAVRGQLPKLWFSFRSFLAIFLKVPFVVSNIGPIQAFGVVFMHRNPIIWSRTDIGKHWSSVGKVDWPDLDGVTSDLRLACPLSEGKALEDSFRMSRLEQFEGFIPFDLQVFCKQLVDNDLIITRLSTFRND